MKIEPAAIWLGTIILVAVAVYLLFCFTTNALASFLHVNSPTPSAEVLIVEGWVPARFAESVKKEFLSGGYKYILVSGLAQDVEIKQGAKKAFPAGRGYIAPSLEGTGIEGLKIKSVPIPNSIRIHKTFSMAKAANRWLYDNDPSVTRVNILTAWNHGRKTWCIYRKVLGSRFSVGILTFPQQKFPIRSWWTTRRGFTWQVLSLANYLYAVIWPLSLVPEPRQ